TGEARQIRGLGQVFDLYRIQGRLVYDGRDYRSPVRELTHPLNYQLPGRNVRAFGDLYYFHRDLGYPERGGLVALEGEWVSGSNDIRYYRIAAEVQRFLTLFWQNRILAFRGRLEKMRRIGDGYVPYTELVQLGGATQYRGYRRGFFRGQGGMIFNVEYRYPIWDTWNVFLFWDEGQIFDHFDQLAWDRFQTAWGGGISFRTQVGLLGKFQAGHSAAEKLLVGFAITQEF
ncbi:MAG: BamA/TamA family outer membrane protein, partial [bacterium]|nr:BamA/TamA family outer membrane protein [bacterium]